MATPPLETKQHCDSSWLIKELTRDCELMAKFEAHASAIFRDDVLVNSETDALLQQVSRSLAGSIAVLESKNKACKVGSRGHSNGSINSNSLKRVADQDDDYGLEQRKKRTCNSRTEYTYTPYHDEYQWRKYGQKMIRGTEFPRGYYRCTYQQEHGCQATKQVQQYNHENPPLFRVIHINEHSCATTNTNIVSSVNFQQIVDSSLRTTFPSHLTSMAHGMKEVEEQALISSLATVIRGSRDGVYDSSNTSSPSHNHSTSTLPTKNCCEDSFPASSSSPALDDFDMDYLMIDSSWFQSLDLDYK